MPSQPAAEYRTLAKMGQDESGEAINGHRASSQSSAEQRLKPPSPPLLPPAQSITSKKSDENATSIKTSVDDDSANGYLLRPIFGSIPKTAASGEFDCEPTREQFF